MINYKNQIDTSENIIKKLVANGTILTDKDKQIIIDDIYQLMLDVSNWKSNGCDCGQMNCLTCHG